MKKCHVLLAQALREVNRKLCPFLEIQVNIIVGTICLSLH